MSSDKITDWGTLWRILRLATPYRSLFILTLALAILLAPVAILRPALINRMVDDHILAHDLPGLQHMVLLLIGILIVESVMRYIFIYQSNNLAQSIVMDLRVRLFKHQLGLRLSYFDKTPVGLNTTRTINDIETINNVFSQGIINILADILGLLAVIGIMLYTSWQLALVCMAALPVMLWGSYVFKERVKSAFQIVRSKISDMNAFLQERISGMQVVQIFSAERQEQERFERINADYTSANIRTVLYYALFFPFVELVAAVSIAFMVWYGAKGVLSDEISPGMLVVFPIYIGMLYRPIRFMADRFNTIQMGMVAGERVFKLLDRVDHIPNEGVQTAERLLGDIRFDHVHFSYETGHKILHDVTFDIKAGETVGVVGSTGSGKSTIINLLNRFYDIQEGRIFVDGHDLTDYELGWLRNRIAMVLQDVFLFTGSLKDNITLHDTTITDEEVLAASKKIGAHQFFEDLPGGYEYEVVERGANLSMGQRQLVSFVRALVFDPDILILDEATSSIDSETEVVIQQAIESLSRDRTSIIIAHRLSTIRHADKILVLDSGQLIESGHPDTLLEDEDGKFRALYDAQLAAHA